jgi:DNA-binding winged helix-turn-helix (wHTH) protein
MKISQRAARKPRTNNTGYDMDYYTIELTVEDLPEELKQKATTVQQLRVLQFLVQRETIIAQVENNYVTVEDAKQRILEYRRFLGDMGTKLEEYGL